MHAGCYVALMIAYVVAALAYGLLLLDAINGELKPEPTIAEIAVDDHSDPNVS